MPTYSETAAPDILPSLSADPVADLSSFGTHEHVLPRRVPRLISVTGNRNPQWHCQAGLDGETYGGAPGDFAAASRRASRPAYPNGGALERERSTRGRSPCSGLMSLVAAWRFPPSPPAPLPASGGGCRKTDKVQDGNDHHISDI